MEVIMTNFHNLGADAMKKIRILWKDLSYESVEYNLWCFMGISNKSIMGKLIVAALLLALAIATVVPRVGPIESHAPLSYMVNLEDPI